ncbi:MAG: AraC family transcriptional regulator [Bacteroidota bacterium]
MNSYSHPLSADQGKAPLLSQGPIRDSLHRGSSSPSSFYASYYVIRYVLEGKEQVKLDGQRLVVEANQFALINPFQEVEINATSQSAFGISFRIAVKDLKQALRTMSVTQSLTEGLIENDRMFLIEQTYPMYGSGLGKLIAQTVSQMEGHASRQTLIDVLGQEELVESLVNHQLIIHQQINNLTSAKLSTRRELFRRLCQARYYIHENLDSPLDLDTLAQVACLSKFHFIRLFKEAFGQTPRQYLIAKRLEAASQLLIHSSKTFHEICHEVGLKDSSSFGRLFKRNFGATPHLYRQLHAAS